MAEVSRQETSVNSVRPGPRRNLRMLSLLLLMIVVVCVVRGGYLVAQRPAFTVSPETTLVSSPLTADGMVDYLAVLDERNSQGVTPDNNAVVLLLRAFGPDVLPERSRRECYRQLGIDSVTIGESTFLGEDENLGMSVSETSAGLAINLRSLDDSLAYSVMQAGREPWSVEAHPEVARWLDGHAGLLDAIVAAAERPSYFMPVAPLSRSAAVLLFPPLIFECRTAARLLAARGMRQLGAGDAESAWRDLLACHRLSRLVGQGAFRESDTVAFSIQDSAYHATSALLAARAFTAHQARQVIADLQDLAPLPDPIQTIDTDERFASLDLICWKIHAAENTGPLTEPRLILIGADGNTMLREVNAMYDRIVAAARAGKHDAGIAEITPRGTNPTEGRAQDGGNSRLVLGCQIAAAGFLGMTSTSSRLIAEDVLHLDRKHFASFLWLSIRSQRQHRMLLIEAALEGHRAEHGEYPETLDALCPEFLSLVPTDLSGDTMFVYERIGGENYELSSTADRTAQSNGSSP